MMIKGKGKKNLWEENTKDENEREREIKVAMFYISGGGWWLWFSTTSCILLKGKNGWNIEKVGMKKSGRSRKEKQNEEDKE